MLPYFLRLIVIEPFDPTAVNCASVDLRLSNEFRYYKPGLTVLPVKEETDYKEITERVNVSASSACFPFVVPSLMVMCSEDGESYLLLPGQACLGITVENIKLDGSICVRHKPYHVAHAVLQGLLGAPVLLPLDVLTQAFNIYRGSLALRASRSVCAHHCGLYEPRHQQQAGLGDLQCF